MRHELIRQPPGINSALNADRDNATTSKSENISVQFLLDTNALFLILKSLILAFIIKICRNLVLIFDKDGREVYLEVKTTKVNRTDFSFIITKNELEHAKIFGDRYSIVIVFDVLGLHQKGNLSQHQRKA